MPYLFVLLFLAIFCYSRLSLAADAAAAVVLIFFFFRFNFGNFNQHSLLNWILYMYISDRTANRLLFLFKCSFMCVRERTKDTGHRLKWNKGFRFVLADDKRLKRNDVDWVCVFVRTSEHILRWFHLKTYHPLLFSWWDTTHFFIATTRFPSNQWIKIKIILDVKRGKICKQYSLSFMTNIKRVCGDCCCCC